MANVTEKERIIKLFSKQNLSDRREILAKLIEIISTNDEDILKDAKISRLTKELELYKKQAGSATKEWVDKKIEENAKKVTKKEEEK